MTQRQYRYRKLINAGFLHFEAQELSKVKLLVPYMEKLINERRKLRDEKEIKRKWTLTRYREFIHDMYEDEGWTKDTGKKKGRKKVLKPDPWQMLREKEDRYKQDHKAWESPWRKKAVKLRKQKEMRDVEVALYATKHKAECKRCGWSGYIHGGELTNCPRCGGKL